MPSRNSHDKWRRWISRRISRIFVCYENPHFARFSVTKCENDLFNFELWMFLAMFGHGLEASICIPLCLWNAMHFCPYRQDKSEILFTFRQFASQHVPSFRLKLALKFGSNKTFLIIFKRWNLAIKHFEYSVLSVFFSSERLTIRHFI